MPVTTNNEPFSIKSVTKGTKAKFDALLKASLLKKSSTSKEKLLEPEILSISSASEIAHISSEPVVNTEEAPEEIEETGQVTEITTVDVHTDDKNFIINKFFKERSKESLNKAETEIITHKAPIPKPRKNINVENVSNSSKGTYEVKRSDSSDSNKTYKVDKSANNSPILKETVHEIAHDDSERNDVQSMKEESSDLKEIESEAIDGGKDKITYEDEVKPKPKARRSKRKPIETEETSLNQYNYENIISLKILKTDYLELNSYVIHPVVKIHFVDLNTGNYLLKSSSNRPVLFYYENKNIKYIGPILTQPYSLQKNRSMFPNWNETIIINEDFQYFMQNKNVILFFEIMDFLNFPAIQSQRGKKHAWHKIAWAFLRHTSPIDGALNVNKKVRLQLYRPGSEQKYTSHDQCDIFGWWKNESLPKYPSTLHVNIQQYKYTQFDQNVITIRSKTPLQEERSSNKISYAKIASSENVEGQIISDNNIKEASNDKLSISEDNVVVKWSRSSYQACKIPNSLLTKLDVYNDGCLLTSFSNDGLFIACSVIVKYIYSVLIYSVITFEEECFFAAHQDFIYSISWSKNDKFLLTGSADWTACIWDVQNKKYVQMLPHPAFVYTSIFSTIGQIATGCFDKTIRIWSKNEDSVYELNQELEDHSGYITTLAFNKSGNILYSGDSTGVLKMWKLKNGENLWHLKRDYNILDLRGLVINEIILHPKERRIFIYSRDNCLRLVDLKNGFVMQRYQSGKTFRTLRFFTISPCFTLLFAGGDNGKVNIWNTDSAKLLASFKPFYNNLPIHCIKFHPFDNILAVSQFSSTSQYVLLYKHEEHPKDSVEFEYFEVGKTLVPPKKPERLKRRTVNEGEPSRGGLVMKSDNKEYKKNLKEIIEKMDEVIEAKCDMFSMM